VAKFVMEKELPGPSGRTSEAFWAIHSPLSGHTERRFWRLEDAWTSRSGRYYRSEADRTHRATFRMRVPNRGRSGMPPARRRANRRFKPLVSPSR
jgi:hypothetical protein